MIQIRLLREWTPPGESKPKKFDKLFDPQVSALSVPELFKNLPHYISQLPPTEKWNLYYTSHPCETKKRKWAGPQGVLPFDIDDIDVENVEAYIAPICDELGIERTKTGVVYSGNGLQFIIGLAQPIQEETFFEKNREHYNAICARIDRLLKEKGLSGFADTSVFSPARLLRLPETENRKAGKMSRFAKLLEPNIEPVSFDLQDKSGLPKIGTTEALPIEALRHFPVDSAAVKEGCEFLKWMKATPAKVSEPQWFGGLSILGRLANGPGEAHDYSKGHKGYNFSETETKLAQALSSSGPRTCKNINSLWGKCHTCPHFEKVNSPISIRGPDFIATESTGFHDIIVSSGKVQRKPNYSDLQRFFAREQKYKVLGGSRICYVWNGKFYKEFEDAYLENFAQAHFKPHALSELVLEFRKLVQRTNIERPEWFENSTDRKTNFQNGVLDVDTMEFSAPSSDRGFRYVLSYNYDKSAVCPNFDRFLSDICQGDESLQHLLLEYAGYALSNDTCWPQKALVLTGEGENGKSTFMNVLRSLAGAGNYMSLPLGELQKEGNRQLLDGKLFNMAEETPTKALTESSLFKNLVSGGETPVRQLYKRPYVMRNKAKLIFACNELPAVSDTTHGFFRRLIIVPFNATFTHKKGNRDDFLEAKLAVELPGIFNRCIEGYHRLKARKKFGESGASARALDSYQLEVNNMKRWALETLVAAA